MARALSAAALRDRADRLTLCNRRPDATGGLEESPLAGIRPGRRLGQVQNPETLLPHGFRRSLAARPNRFDSAESALYTYASLCRRAPVVELVYTAG